MLKKIIALWFLAIVMAYIPVSSEAAAKVIVTLIEVKGNRRIETATILAKIKTREGALFSPSLIKEDIKELYRLGHFEDVQVKTEGFEDGLKVIFVVKEKPLIRGITFEGHDTFSEEDLKEGLNLLPRTAFNIPLLHENAEKIRLKYQDKGYYDVVIVPVIKELRGGDRSVVFYIEEGKKVKLEDIVITGNAAIAAKTIRKAMRNKEHGFFSFLGRSGTLRIPELKEDIEIIRNLYYNKGYIQVKIDEPVIEKKTYTKRGKEVTKKNQIVLRINIQEGDQFQVGSIFFRGNESLNETALRDELQFKPGDIFSREALRKSVSRIIDRYDSVAKPFASVVPLFNIDSKTKSIDITVKIEEGGEVRIGRIDITGNTKTRDKVIRREMRLDEGDLYSKKALRRSYERIHNLNFFETVDVVPERRGREPIMDLGVKVEEKLTGSFSIGGGYSSVDGIIGMFEITQGNFAGRGQVVKFKTQLGGTRRIFVVSFTEPWLFDKPVYGKVDLYNQTQEYDGYSLKSRGFALGTGKRYGEYISTSLRYSYDQTTTIDVINPPESVINQRIEYGEEIFTSALTGSVSRDSRDFYLDPKKGSRNSVFVKYAGGVLGGDPNFVKAVVDSGWYFPLFWDTVFMLRGRYGYARSLIDKSLPVAERFFVGGSSTVRGFEYGAAGPLEPIYDDFTSPTRTVIDFNRAGGVEQLIFNAEYSYPIIPAARLKGVLFYDIGRAFDDAVDGVDFRLSELRHTWGFGFRWLTPMGPLRFEWGYIINEQPTDQTSRFDFSIGTMF